MPKIKVGDMLLTTANNICNKNNKICYNADNEKTCILWDEEGLTCMFRSNMMSYHFGLKSKYSDIEVEVPEDILA